MTTNDTKGSNFERIVRRFMAYVVNYLKKELRTIKKHFFVLNFKLRI